MSALVDSYYRRLNYLRLSVTDLCNFKCNYCLPNGYQGKKNPNELTVQEIDMLVRVFAKLGTKKVRITGGEPTLRKDLADIIAVCKQQEGIESVALTSNGFRLDRLYSKYQAAGLDKLNISVDSFDPVLFKQITGKNECEKILSAIDHILEEGTISLKINTLLLKEFFQGSLKPVFDYVRTRPLKLRFIELMQTGDNYDFFKKQHIAASVIESELLERGWLPDTRSAYSGPAREYSHPEYLGGIGFIAPYSKDFCATCNRLRITAQGKLHLCLFGGVAYDIRPYLIAADEAGLEDFLGDIVVEKPEHHFLNDKKVGLIRDLSMIGG